MNQYLKTTLEGITLASLILTSGCGLKYKTIDSHIEKVDNKEITQKQEYTFEDLKKALGPRWNKLSRDEKKKVEKDWNESNNDEKKLIHTIYSNPNSIYSSLESEEQKKVYNLDQKSTERYKSVPWINFENPSLADKLLMYIDTDTYSNIMYAIDKITYPQKDFDGDLKDIDLKNHFKNLDYSFEDFKKGLGPKWDKLSRDEKKKVKGVWIESDNDWKRLVCFIYRNPNKSYAIFLQLEEPEERKRIYNLNLGSFEKYIGDIPWIELKNPTLADRLFMYYAVDRLKPKGVQ